MDNFIEEECCTCGVLFAISKALQLNWKDNNQTFYCPNGHRQSYIKSTEQTLRENIKLKERRIETLEIENNKIERK